MYFEDTFSVERITLSNLVENLRFLLYFYLKVDYKSNLIKTSNENISPLIAKEVSPFHDLLFNADILETTEIDKLRSSFDYSLY
jgi:hypothetical protein